MEKENKVVVSEIKEVELNYFEKLNRIDVSKKTEKKNGLTYLSWAWAWGEVKKLFPDSTYTIYENEEHYIYHHDKKTAWVKTGVTVNGIEHIEYLPVMNFKNQSITIDVITSFDVNKAIQRSLTKAVARHGLGLYIYAGEDLPEQIGGEEKEVEVKDIAIKDKDEAIRANTKQQVADLYEALAAPRKVGFNGWLQKTFNAISFDDLTEAQGRVIIQTLSKESK